MLGSAISLSTLFASVKMVLKTSFSLYFGNSSKNSEKADSQPVLRYSLINSSNTSPSTAYRLLENIYFMPTRELRSILISNRVK